LATAYYLKVKLRLLWEQAAVEEAGRLLEDCCGRARVSGVRMLSRFAETLERDRDGLLAWYAFPISTGPLEGTNNTITTSIKPASGFRDRESFRSKLYALPLTRCELIG